MSANFTRKPLSIIISISNCDQDVDQSVERHHDLAPSDANEPHPTSPLEAISPEAASFCVERVGHLALCDKCFTAISITLLERLDLPHPREMRPRRNAGA